MSRAKHHAAPPDTAWRRYSPYGKIAHAAGAAPALLTAGWLPRARAAEAMGVSLADLDRAVEFGAVRTRLVGPCARLYEVPR